MSRICLPINQVRLTNVAVVRINRHGKRFEVACYRNKALNFRQGVETDLSEVLQTDRIFTNVSKGEFAPAKSLKHSFNTTNEEEIAQYILKNGEVQVTDMERSSLQEGRMLEIASMVAAKCVNPGSNRPHTLDVVRDSMRKAEFLADSRQSVKQQFLNCVKVLKQKNVLPIERAKMELCAVGIPAALRIGDDLRVAGADVTKVDDGRVTMLIDPSLYREIDRIVKAVPGGRLEIMRQNVTEEGDINLECEVERKDKMSSVATAGVEKMTNTLPTEKQIDSIEEVFAKKAQISSTSGIVNSAVQDSDEDDHQDSIIPASNNRKNQRKAQKKSKKAKRREKEEALEREERLKKEKERQDERALRLGLEEGTDQPGGEGPGEQPLSKAKSCNTCGGEFTNVEYRAHFRSDWHRFNLKLKMKKTACVSEEEFRLCDADAFFEEFA